MMITITNKNIYRSDFSISDLSSLDKADIIDPNDIVHFLSDPVELGESVTFKRLFDIVSYNLFTFNDIFYSALGGYTLEPFLQEIENNPTESVESDFLEIYWHCDKYEDDLTIDPSLHGVSNTTSEKYAMDFVSLNNMKNYVLKINKRVELFDIELKDSIFLGNKILSLFELYNTIFYEISFFGGPQDKKEKFMEIEESIKETENMEFKDYITFEDMIKNFDAKDKYLVKYKEQRDRVEKDRITDKKKLTKLKNCLIEKLKIYDIIENNDENLSQYYKKLTNIEFDMQTLYGENEDILYHKFWLTPKCTCPKIDNTENYLSEKPIFDENCPIHKK